MKITERILALLALLCLFAPAALHADKTLEGEATFYGDSRHSLDDCKQGALLMARYKALEKEYGLAVVSSTVSNATNRDGNETSYFQTLNMSDVRGIWVADEMEPKYEVGMGSDGLYVVTCKVRGKTRPLSNQAPEFKSVVLRNGYTELNSGTAFRDGDRMHVLFKSPVKGYLAAYMCCEDGQAYSLLPYLGDEDGKAEVAANREYVLFSAKHDELGETNDAKLETDDFEVVRLYMIFSPNEFTKGLDGGSQTEADGDILPPSMPLKDFSKWLSTRMSRDPKMGLQIHVLTIEK